MDTKKMYENVMNRFRWGNANDPDVYLDENNRRTLSNFRRMFGMLANGLVLEGDIERAREVLSRCQEVIPASKVPHDFYSMGLVEAMFKIGDDESAMELPPK
ncbi:MAG: hypothetical protein R2744_10000 [Bacteroidales bacterium]